MGVPYPDEGFESPAMQYALDLCRLYAPVLRPIVFVGPVGSGKTTIAEHVHHQSGRSGPFVVVSAGELTETLYADTLFGHVAGAYTGAGQRRGGAFAAAKGGTLLIDDLALMPLAPQVALLKVLESARYRPLGRDDEAEARCRILVASTELPHDLARDGRLLVDLASRLGDLIVEIPPLCHRRQDILPIARQCAQSFLDEHESPSSVAFSNETIALMEAYDWPSNVRELRAAIERSVIHAGLSEEAVVIRPMHLPERIRTFDVADRPQMKVTSDLVRRVVEQAGGNQSEAARRLEVHRSTIRRHLGLQD